MAFDFDYTLTDSSRAAEKTTNAALERMGEPAAEYRAICDTIGLSLEETYARRVRDAERAALFRRLFTEESPRHMVAHSRVYDDVPPTIAKLHAAGLVLVIVSTTFRCRIEEILVGAGLAAEFAEIIGGDDVTRAKPDPEGLFGGSRAPRGRAERGDLRGGIAGSTLRWRAARRWISSRSSPG